VLKKFRPNGDLSWMRKDGTWISGIESIRIETLIEEGWLIDLTLVYRKIAN